MPTPQKEQVIKDTAERIQGVQGVYLADFTGMDVGTLSALRKKCREENIQFRVIKNTLLKRAFAEHGLQALDEHLVGPTGLVFSPTSEVAPARVLADFAKEHERPRIKAAVVDGRFYDDQAIRELAALPSREILMSQVLASLIAPLTQFLGLIQSTVALPATLVDALARKKGESS
jgi:large subunit ribosomal protein L10